MFEAVESLVDEHAALEQRMADPAVHADPAQAKKVGQPVRRADRRAAHLPRVAAGR